MTIAQFNQLNTEIYALAGLIACVFIVAAIAALAALAALNRK